MLTYRQHEICFATQRQPRLQRAANTERQTCWRTHRRKKRNVKQTSEILFCLMSRSRYWGWLTATLNIHYTYTWPLIINFIFSSLKTPSPTRSTRKDATSQFNDGERNLMIAKESREGERGNDKQVVISRHTKLKCKLLDLWKFELFNDPALYDYDDIVNPNRDEFLNNREWKSMRQLDDSLTWGCRHLVQFSKRKFAWNISVSLLRLLERELT